MTPNDVTAYWQTTARESFSSAETLFKAKHFDHALFFLSFGIGKNSQRVSVEKNQQSSPPHTRSRQADRTSRTLYEHHAAGSTQRNYHMEH